MLTDYTAASKVSSVPHHSPSVPVLKCWSLCASGEGMIRVQTSCARGTGTAHCRHTMELTDVSVSWSHCTAAPWEFYFIGTLVEHLISRWALRASQWHLFCAILCFWACALALCNSEWVEWLGLQLTVSVLIPFYLKSFHISDITHWEWLVIKMEHNKTIVAQFQWEWDTTRMEHSRTIVLQWEWDTGGPLCPSPNGNGAQQEWNTVGPLCPSGNGTQ